jgi:hypothetical protein
MKSGLCRLPCGSRASTKGDDSSTRRPSGATMHAISRSFSFGLHEPVAGCIDHVASSSADRICIILSSCSTRERFLGFSSKGRQVKS